jgi:hypothetical protein
VNLIQAFTSQLLDEVYSFYGFAKESRQKNCTQLIFLCSIAYDELKLTNFLGHLLLIRNITPHALICFLHSQAIKNQNYLTLVKKLNYLQIPGKKNAA